MSPKAQSTATLEAGSPELRFALGELRSTLRRALAFGLCASLLALTPSWYMLEVYDRVVNSRNGLTLLMLTLAVLLAYAVIQVQEWTREALLRHAARSFDQRLAEIQRGRDRAIECLHRTKNHPGRQPSGGHRRPAARADAGRRSRRGRS